MPRRAFTLIELLVVIAIIGLLSTVAIVALNGSRINARNQKRKADLIQISKALELYYADNGKYPVANMIGSCTNMGGNSDTGEEGWIPNLAPSYMATLPRDPNSSKTNPNGVGSCVSDAGWNCYAYRGSETDYKIIAHCTPEGALATTDQFFDPSRPTYSWAVYTPGATAW